MDQIYQRYIDNLHAARNLAKPRTESGMTGEEMLRAIRDNADKLFLIHQENDDILQEILFSKKAENLTREEAEQLCALASELFDFNRSEDVGIAYRIHRLLYAYARYHGDVDLIVKELYYQGITMFYLNVRNQDVGVNLFREEIGTFFREGASYLEQYETLENPQTRAFILRCLGNLKYGLEESGDSIMNTGWEEYMACFSEAMDVFLSPRYREMNPELPWDTFAYTMHYDRTKFLAGLRERHDDVIAWAVMESAEHVYRHQEQLAKAGEKGIGARTQYVYAAARYHAGLAGIQELLEVLFGLCESANLHDFSGDNIWVILNTPAYLMRYSEELPEKEREALQPRLHAAFDKLKEYLFLIPRNEYGVQVPQSIQNFVGYMSTRDTEFFRQILDYILACHPPTFIHSRVVAMLARRLCAQMARVNPKALEGIFGYEGVGEIRKNLEQILDLTYQAGLYHDLGKCMLLGSVSLYSRRLLDEEFACIRLHPVFGCSLLDSLHMEDMSQVAYYHHLSYDGSGGYPRSVRDCPRRVRCIADIVTVVDCLDAGTDNVGRSYAAAKTYGRLVEELRQGKGSRYAPEVVELFDDPEFYAETGKFLDALRREVYLDIYHGV